MNTAQITALQASSETIQVCIAVLQSVQEAWTLGYTRESRHAAIRDFIAAVATPVCLLLMHLLKTSLCDQMSYLTPSMSCDSVVSVCS